jgi:hypothetical protein
MPVPEYGSVEYRLDVWYSPKWICPIGSFSIMLISTGVFLNKIFYEKD